MTFYHVFPCFSGANLISTQIGLRPRSLKIEYSYPLGRAATLSTGIDPKKLSSSPSASRRSSSTDSMEYRLSASDHRMARWAPSSSGRRAREAAGRLT